MDVVFICVDSAKVRSFISRHLMDHNIQFVDSGLGLTLGTGSVGGQVRVTSFFGGTGEYIKDIFGTAEVKDDGVYATNIQIALLNSLAAIMMLNCWLKHINFLMLCHSIKMSCTMWVWVNYSHSLMNSLVPEFVEFLPMNLEEGKLYISMKYCTAVHLCACGCGERVVTPLQPNGWKLSFDGVVTLRWAFNR